MNRSASRRSTRSVFLLAPMAVFLSTSPVEAGLFESALQWGRRPKLMHEVRAMRALFRKTRMLKEHRTDLNASLDKVVRAAFAKPESVDVDRDVGERSRCRTQSRLGMESRTASRSR